MGLDKQVTARRNKMVNESGDNFNHSSTPLYPERVGHISRMFCAVSESLQAEAMARRAAVVSCLATAGRPSEVAALEIKRLDPTLNCFFGELLIFSLLRGSFPLLTV